VTDQFSIGRARDFGSVVRTMVILFQSVTGGCDWAVVYDLISTSGPGYAGAFLFYVVFFFMSFLNISTSLFVEKALSLAKPDGEDVMLERRRKEERAAKELRGLIEILDSNNSGIVSREEWRELSQDPDFRMFFELCNLDIRDADAFFTALMHVTGTADIDIDSFVDGCMKMKGEASSIDVQILLAEVRLIKSSLAGSHQASITDHPTCQGRSGSSDPS